MNMLAVTDGETAPPLPPPFSMESILGRRSDRGGSQPLDLAGDVTRGERPSSPGSHSPAAAAGAGAGTDETIDIDVDTEDTDTGE